MTASLTAGRYTFALQGAGDADLYETCTIELTAPTAIHVMVRGYAASSTFTLAGRQ